MNFLNFLNLAALTIAQKRLSAYEIFMSTNTNNFCQNSHTIFLENTVCSNENYFNEILCVFDEEICEEHEHHHHTKQKEEDSNDILKKLRAQRLAELQASSKGKREKMEKGFGSYTKITEHQLDHQLQNFSSF